jgi:hypothetical protein
MIFFFIFFLIGEISLVYFLLKNKFKFNNLFAHIDIIPKTNYSLHIFFLSVLFFFAFLGSINNFVFYNNFSIQSTIYIHALFSFIGYFFLFKNIGISVKTIGINKFYKKLQLHLKKNWLIFFLIIFNFFIILNRSFVDWNDQDEITQYGYYTRLFSQGWQVSDNFLQYPDLNGEIFGFFTRFGELMLSPFYLIYDDFLIIRVLRYFLFIIIIFFYFFLINCITNSIKISLVCTCLIITIPEFSYVGPFSLKTDFLLFVYESISLIFLIFFIISYRTKKEFNYDKKIILDFFLISLSVFFSIFAFAIRLSGVYLLIISSLIYLYFLIKNKKFFYKINYSLFILFFFLLANGPGIFHQISTYSNPFYPMDGFWLRFFNGKHGGEEWLSDFVNKNYNINIQIPILNQLYIFIYHTLGFGRSFYGNLSFYENLYHPLLNSQTGWLSPVSLIIFLVPFYFKKIKNIFIIFAVFIFLYLFWVSFLQSVRVLLATSCILIILFSLIFKFEKIKNSYLYKILNFLSFLCCLFFTYYHFNISVTNNPYGLNMYLIKNIKFEDNLIKSLSRDDWNTYIKKDIAYISQSKKINNRKEINFYETYLFNKNDFQQINKILKQQDKKIIIYHNLEKFEHLQTLINYGYVKLLRNDQFNLYLNKNKYFYKTCFILKNEENIIDKFDFRIVYQTVGKLRFYCNI